MHAFAFIIFIFSLVLWHVGLTQFLSVKLDDKNKTLFSLLSLHFQFCISDLQTRTPLGTKWNKYHRLHPLQFQQTSAFQTITYMNHVEEIVKIQTDSVDLGGSLRVCPSNNFLGDASAACPLTIVQVLRRLDHTLHVTTDPVCCILVYPKPNSIHSTQKQHHKFFESMNKSYKYGPISYLWEVKFNLIYFYSQLLIIVISIYLMPSTILDTSRTLFSVYNNPTSYVIFPY